MVVACDEDPINPPIQKTTGEVSFVVDAGNNETGSGTSSSPVVVTSGEALDMVITQKSSYTNPDGTVYTCEPEASIKLSATLDKVYAKDIKSLITINESVGVETSQSGTNPVTNTTVQTFEIGNQQIVFDLEYEVYRYVNSLSNQIEMPYIKVNQAKFGKSNATEKEGTRSTSPPPIVLRSLSLTRASVTDSATFEVTARFNLELETVNTEKKQTKSLDFDVTYLGVVENVTELYGSVVYSFNNGTGETNSPFVVEGGKELVVNIAQTSTFANGDNAVYTAEPKASIKLKVKNEVDSAESMERLTTLVSAGEGNASQSGENPLVNLYKRTFTTAGQTFDFEMSYEVYSAESGDEMPYLKLGEPNLVKIDVKKQEAKTRAAGYETVYYDVTAKFEVEIEGVNVTDETKETLVFDVKYVGALKETVELSGDVNYTIGDGTTDMKSPFVVSGGNELNLVIKQTSTYANGDEVMYTAEPKAVIKLKAKNASNFVEELKALSTMIETEDPVVSKNGENPVVNVYKGSFATAGQVFDFETSYEVYKTENGDEFPYLKFSEPKLIGIEVKERAKTRVIVKDTTYYDVKAKFEIAVEGVNTAEKLNETMSFEVDYTGGVVTSKDVPLELIKTEYRKDMIVYEGHDNLSLRAQAVVYRDNYYSDGSIQVDTLRENVAMQLLSYSISENPKGTKVVDDGDGYSGTYQITDGITMRYKRHEAYKNTHTEFVFKYVSSVEVPDFDNLRSIRSGGLDWEDGLWGQVGPTDDLSQYDIFGVDTYYDASNPLDGVYCYSVDNDFQNELRYRYNNKNYDLVSLKFAVGWYDRIASIDGELITFEEFRPTLKDVKDFKSYEEVEATSTRGPARVYTAEVKGTYLGREVHLMSVDTVYVAK